MVFARQRSSETSTRGGRVTSDFNDEFITDRDNRLSTLFNTTRKLPFFTTPRHIYSLIFYKIGFTFHIFLFLISVANTSMYTNICIDKEHITRVLFTYILFVLLFPPNNRVSGSCLIRPERTIGNIVFYDQLTSRKFWPYLSGNFLSAFTNQVIHAAVH